MSGEVRVPVRIQRRRTKGWEMPEGAIYVGRPTIWGNPVRIGRNVEMVTRYETDLCDVAVIYTPQQAVAAFRGYAGRRARLEPGWLAPLRGRDLCCWCPLDQPCHADVLLELANAR